MLSTTGPGGIGGTQTPWGLWATVGLSLIVSIVFLTLSAAVAACFAAVAYFNNPEVNMTELAESLQSNGFFLSIATCVTSAFCLGLTVLFARLRKGLTVKEYLALNGVPRKVLLTWLLLLMLFIACSDGFTLLLGRPIITDIMVNAYETAHLVSLLWIAIVVVAPLFEEAFVRGFIFRGIQQSKLGNIGAVVITALLWSSIHIQYDIYDRARILASGILIGIARLRSESLYLAIAMHSTMNLIGMIQVRVYIGW